VLIIEHLESFVFDDGNSMQCLNARLDNDIIINSVGGKSELLSKVILPVHFSIHMFFMLLGFFFYIDLIRSATMVISYILNWVTVFTVLSKTFVGCYDIYY